VRRHVVPQVVGAGLFLAAIAVSCHADPPAYLEFDGSRYLALSADATAIDSRDLHHVGTASKVWAPVAGSAVYAIGGVRPSDAVAMPALEAEEFIVFVRPVDGFRLPSLGSIGLCPYLVIADQSC
jgi:hypothetical protein